MTTAERGRNYSYSITESDHKVKGVNNLDNKDDASIFIDSDEYLDEEEYLKILGERRALREEDEKQAHMENIRGLVGQIKDFEKEIRTLE